MEDARELSLEPVMIDHLQNYREISDAVQERLIKQQELLAQYDIRKRLEEQQALIKHVRALDGTLYIDPNVVVAQQKKPAPSKEELKRRREAAKAWRKRNRLGRSRSSIEDTDPDTARPDSSGGARPDEEGAHLRTSSSIEDPVPITAEDIALANAAAAETKLRELLLHSMQAGEARQEGLQIRDDLNSKFLVTFKYDEKGEKVMDLPIETKMAPVQRDKNIAIAFVKKQDSSEEIMYR